LPGGENFQKSPEIRHFLFLIFFDFFIFLRKKIRRAPQKPIRPPIRIAESIVGSW